uniref:Odorant receptor 33b n=1 Tax=Drosophila melanogaster TaxID=7227 RepID=OR33B_DROME|nr:odorant receptor 33b [Drosophila melanogaster]P81915.1 RecName: Full=Odorant receptor 33b [Drosophila melanogaster]AAF53132.1 odorant receptor 33b [Drosophila melanogaster]|eukprot:NP_523554.1 odorant receptor 33b [Drosophila melanogaster]
MDLKPRVIRSEDIYRTYWLYWHLLGLESNFFLNRLLDLVITIFVTIWYPIHLILGLFMERSLGDVCKGLPITAACFFASFKFICFRFKLSEIKEIEILFKELDQRALSREECEFFNQNTRREANFIWKSFIVAYGLSNISAIASVLFGGGHKLLYPAWFPYDVQATELIFWLSVTYQIAGVSLAILQNLANDSYPPMTFCVVAGHVRLLAMRLSRIGQGPEETIYLTGKQLIESIEDHRKLMKIVELLRSTMNISQLGQFISSGVNISITLVNILFFADNNFAITYYGVYFLSMVLELFPCCYYGTLISVEMNQLTYAIYSSNWMSMNRSYSRILLIFMQLTLAEVQIKAGGMIGIGMNAFFATVRLAYSFFTLAMSLR